MINKFFFPQQNGKKSEESCTFVIRKLKEHRNEKYFQAAVSRKLDAYTIENEPIASIDLMERAATVLTKAITDRWNTETPVTIFAGPGE